MSWSVLNSAKDVGEEKAEVAWGALERSGPEVACVPSAQVLLARTQSRGPRLLEGPEVEEPVGTGLNSDCFCHVCYLLAF